MKFNRILSFICLALVFAILFLDAHVGKIARRKKMGISGACGTNGYYVGVKSGNCKCKETHADCACPGWGSDKSSFCCNNGGLDNHGQCK
jgi:hypothetical protein